MRLLTIFCSMIFLTMVLLGQTPASAPVQGAGQLGDLEPNWQSLFQAFGIPGAFGVVMIFILKKVGSFLSDERDAQKKHMQEINDAKNEMIEHVIGGAKSIAEENTRAAGEFNKACDTLSAITLQSRELARELRIQAPTRPTG